DGGAGNQPEADVVSAGAEDRGNDVVFTLLVDRPTDPKTTKNWEGSTGAAWEVDTNGDNAPEYLVAFGRNQNGQLAVQVARVDNQAGAAAGCAGTASLGPKGEFVATVPAGCLGDPASFRYGAAMSWDTDPANDNAPAVSHRPAQTVATAIATVAVMARQGRAVSRWAVAAGVVINPSSSSAPTTCTSWAIMTPAATRKTTFKARTGMPRASATPGSIVANSK